MAGLSAVVLRDSSSVGAVTDDMLTRMTHYPWLVKRAHVESAAGVGLGVVTFESTAWRGDRVRRPVHCGAPRRDLRHRIGSAARLDAAGRPVEGGSAAALLLAGWRHEGPAFLARLHGEFAAAIWDADGSARCTSSPIGFGLRPVYVAQPRGEFVAASEIKAVLAVPGVDTSWSEDGVAEFFGFGHFLGASTLFKGVRAVPPATVGTWRADEAAYDEQPYWRMEMQASSDSPANLSEALEERFVAAVERRARPGERLGLSLSGGLDARTILGVMPGGLDVQSVSLGIDGSLDHRSAAELARLAGIPHHTFVLDAAFLSAFEQHLREMVRLTDGHYLDQGIVMPTMPLYRQAGIEDPTRGHGGELLHMTKVYAFSLDAVALAASEASLDGWLFSHLSGYMLDAVPEDLFTLDVRAAARASLRAPWRAVRPRAGRSIPRLGAVPQRAHSPGDGALDAHVRLLRDHPAAVPGQRRRRRAALDAGGDEARRRAAAADPGTPAAGVPRRDELEYGDAARSEPAGDGGRALPDARPGEARRQGLPAVRAAWVVVASRAARHGRLDAGRRSVPLAGVLPARRGAPGARAACVGPGQSHVSDHVAVCLRARATDARRAERVPAAGRRIADGTRLSGSSLPHRDFVDSRPRLLANWPEHGAVLAELLLLPAERRPHVQEKSLV